MAFTAKDVAELRAKTGCGMMDCKKALTEAEGNMDAAIDLLREKGLAASQKKAGRIAAEGIAFSKTNDDSTVGVVIEVNSETDFVAKNKDFQMFVEQLADTVIATNPADVEALMACTLAGTEVTVEAALQEKVLTIGENIKIRRFQRYEGAVASYIHAGGKIGVLVNFETTADIAAKDEFVAMGKDVSMQVAAAMPLFLDEASVPAETIAHEKEIMTALVLNEGKPAAIAEKIVAGKISKYFKEVCLLDQVFVKDNDYTIAKYVAKIAKDLGGDIKLVAFSRFEKGEGLEKRNDNFADEVASMTK